MPVWEGPSWARLAGPAGEGSENSQPGTRWLIRLGRGRPRVFKLYLVTFCYSQYSDCSIGEIHEPSQQAAWACADTRSPAPLCRLRPLTIPWPSPPDRSSPPPLQLSTPLPPATLSKNQHRLLLTRSPSVTHQQFDMKSLTLLAPLALLSASALVAALPSHPGRRQLQARNRALGVAILDDNGDYADLSGTGGLAKRDVVRADGDGALVKRKTSESSGGEAVRVTRGVGPNTDHRSVSLAATKRKASSSKLAPFDYSDVGVTSS